MTNATLDQLTARGPVQSGDLVPILPVGATVLQNETAAALRTFMLAGSGAQSGLVVLAPSGDTTGATDTAAIQAALNTGADVYLAPGVYYTNATLTITTVAQHGQRLYGAGPTSTTGLGALATIIRPTAAVTTAIKIDGTPFSGFVQSFRVDALTIDMVNMADLSTSVAINQVQAFDLSYDRIRVINDGVNKRGWLFTTGAYTTTIANCQAQIVEGIGTSTAMGVTTLTFINFDGNQVRMTYAANIRFYGGAFQGTGSTKFRLRFATAIQLDTDVEGTGVFLDVDNSVNGLWSRCELQGFSGTYMVGTPGQSAMLLDQQVNFNTYPFNLGVGSFNFNNQGAAGHSSILSGAAGAYYYLDMGRAGSDVRLGVASSANDFLSGTAAGDAALFSLGGGSALWLGGAQQPQAKVTSTGFNTFGTGALQQGIVLIKPSADTDVFSVYNAAGTAKFDINTSGTGTTSLLNGGVLIGYSDGFSTQKWSLNATTGNLVLTGGVFVGALQVVGARQTGWGAASGTLSRAAYAAYAGQTYTGAYVQATAQATDDAVKALAQQFAALRVDLTAHGLIGP